MISIHPFYPRRRLGLKQTIKKSCPGRTIPRESYVIVRLSDPGESFLHICYMPPKPFPYPIGIGIDVCKPSRIVRLMRDHDKLNRWLRKVFNRLEWPQLVSSFKGAQNAAPGDIGHPRDDFNRHQPLILSHSWIPPPPSTKNVRVPATINALAQHLAGRLAPPPPPPPPPSKFPLTF